MHCTEACVTTGHVKWDDNHTEKKDTVFQRGLDFYNIFDESQRNHAHEWSVSLQSKHFKFEYCFSLTFIAIFRYFGVKIPNPLEFKC